VKFYKKETSNVFTLEIKSSKKDKLSLKYEYSMAEPAAKKWGNVYE
jgi:hypothetical protein